MHRLFRLSILVALLCILGLRTSNAQTPVELSGGVPASEVRVLLYDPMRSYYVAGDFDIYGTLIIEPGVTLYFNADSRIKVEAGGRFIADGQAKATYLAAPDGFVPVRNNPELNPNGWLGYGDLEYFLYSSETAKTLTTNTVRDLTIHRDKVNEIFNVTLNKSTRALKNVNGGSANEVQISFEQAIVYEAAGIKAIDPTDPTNYKNSNPWTRNSGNSDVVRSVNFSPERIRFIGKPVLNGYSKEWGHIVVLPGAKAAFFRDCDFEKFKKDTTVDNKAYYAAIAGKTAAEVKAINAAMLKMSNGGGGAITTFSSRTWVLNSTFTQNFARHNGGALQILQTPEGFPVPNKAVGFYPATKNPNLTDRFGNISTINNKVKAIDFIDEAASMPEWTDAERQCYDDARTALFLGRFRNLEFTNNTVQLANFGRKTIGSIVYVDELTEEDAFVRSLVWRNQAFGGAIYISGAENNVIKDEVLVGFGVNNSINADGQLKTFPTADRFFATGNKALNYQNSAMSKGARGGAIYVGENTSLIVDGTLTNNEASAPRYEAVTLGYAKGALAFGGAIYQAQSIGELGIRGAIDNPTEFSGNKAGMGGAIFVASNQDTRPRLSPMIGGSDATLNTRDYGVNVKFENNSAIAAGGAIYTNRNMAIHGAGGVANDVLLSYSGLNRVQFKNNAAGYAGGAIDVNLPAIMADKAVNHRDVHIVRAIFEGNKVGEGITDYANVSQIRGGGAIYSVFADINMVKAAEFLKNTVYNANGAAIAMVSPSTATKRYFATDLDNVTFDANGAAIAMDRRNDIFTFNSNVFAPDVKMLTRFLENKAIVSDEYRDTLMGSGTTQIGVGTLITPSNLYGIAFRTNNNGVVVGQGSTIIRLTQNPNGWDWQYKNWSNNTVDLYDVTYVTPQILVAVGTNGIILKSTDDGITWAAKKQPVNTYHLNSVQFLSNTTGYTVGTNGTILKTVDAGETWTSVSVNGLSTTDLASVYFASNNLGFIVGKNGTALRTADAGATWLQIGLGTISVNLKGVSFVNINEGYIAGEFGAILKTTDGGLVWNYDYSNTALSLNRVVIPPANPNGIAIGSTGTVLRKENGTWTTVASFTTKNLNDVMFPFGNNGFIAADNGHIFSTTDGGQTWEQIRPADLSVIDVKRWHPEPSVTLPENGVGLGGAIYVLDKQEYSRIARTDSILFNRVRFQENEAFSGAAVYSDNFNLSLNFERSLINKNVATSTVGQEQNVIRGAMYSADNQIHNLASSDLAGAIIYGEMNGPLPTWTYSVAANSIYDNTARFIVRIPDAPNTKGILAGTTGIGFSGADSLGGNYWGKTEANVGISYANGDYANTLKETFYVETDQTTTLEFLKNPTVGRTKSLALQQGPFESIGKYAYNAIPMQNGANENTPDTQNSIPEKLLMSGHVYDMYDKGTDIKIADYSNRRMCPIEDFSVGMLRNIQKYNNLAKPSDGKYIKRWLRDPFFVEATETNFLGFFQDEFLPDTAGNLYHPIGYPLYLEAKADYTGSADVSNDDARMLNETVYFVINETTGDFIRVNMKQVDEAAKKTTFRARVELVPDETNRNADSKIRRSNEGLLNLGVGSELLTALYRNAFNEDKATLLGRRYEAAKNLLGANPNLFSNRPDLPANNQGTATFYAGERYRALPVNVGDRVSVISRTMLWREGYKNAYDGRLEFTIGESINPPEFTGNIVDLQNVSNPKFRNVIQVTEDREYPVDLGVYSDKGTAAGRDSILSVTAIDRNHFYNPASFSSPDKYSRLAYDIQYGENSGLSRWLRWDDFKVTTDGTTNVKDGAEGYEVLRGKPLNPWIVPGGEKVTIRVENFPPHWRVIDSLKKYNDPALTPDIIAALFPIYPQYMHAWVYDNQLARYLQQDTIDVASKYQSRYDFTLFVVDSAPRFIEYNEPETQVTMRMNTDGSEVKDYVKYTPSVYTAGVYPLNPDNPDQGFKLVANVTDKLRFQVDYNTNDEIEDAFATTWDATIGKTNIWDFPYGRTAYGFSNTSINKGDIIVIDTSDIVWRGNDQKVMNQVRPSWMDKKYMFLYGQEDNRDLTGGEELIKTGKLNIRIPKDEAYTLLTPTVQVNNTMITDTVFAIIANDGHGKIASKQLPVFINFAPSITTTSLPDAMEDFEYNDTKVPNQMIDSSKIVKVYDPNFEQKHHYELIYAGDVRDSIAKDPYYPEAGSWKLEGLKTTPQWLKINPISGLLYGTPGLQDAPKDEKVTVVVWDVINRGGDTGDEYVLSDLKVFDLKVISVNHNPSLSDIPPVKCVEKGQPYEQIISANDIDLLRKVADAKEVLSLTVKPSTLTIEPSTINGGIDVSKVDVKISATSLNLTPDPTDNKVTVTVYITDKAGVADSIKYKLQYSDPTRFVCPLLVTSARGEQQMLEWGTADFATTGFADDGAPEGMIDSNYCETEIPPKPFQDVFDVRWRIINKQGLLRNIYPTAITGQSDVVKTRDYQAEIETNKDALRYPIRVQWDARNIPDVTDNVKNPAGSTWYIMDLMSSQGNKFLYNMKTGAGKSGISSNVAAININGTQMELELRSTSLTGFAIFYDMYSPVNNDATFTTRIQSVTPNPVENSAMIKFSVAHDSNVKIDVIDNLGNVVKVIASEFESGIGSYDLPFDASTLSSGTYTVRMTAGNEVTTYQMVIVK